MDVVHSEYVLFRSKWFVLVIWYIGNGVVHSYVIEAAVVACATGCIYVIV